MARLISPALVRGAILLALGAPALGQQTQPATAPAEEVPEVRPFNLLFVVVDKETREPIPDVKVRWIARDAHGNFGGRGVTGEAGDYVFELPSNKLPHLGTAIRMPGYIPMGTRWSGTIPTNYTLEMERGVTIGGTVVDDAGKPVVGARVTLRVRCDTGRANAAYDIQGDWVKTEADGVWTYDRVPAGFTAVSMSVADPRYVSGDGAARSDVKPEEALARGLVLTLRHGQTIGGVVTDANGRAVEGAAIHVATDTEADEADAGLKTDRDGKFQVTVDPARRQRLVIAKEGLAPELIDPGTLKEADPVKVALKAGEPLRLKLADPDGRPIAGAWILVTSWRGTAFRESIQANAEGEIVWPSAPADEVQFDAIASGHQLRRALRVKPSPETQVITLTPTR